MSGVRGRVGSEFDGLGALDDSDVGYMPFLIFTLEKGVLTSDLLSKVFFGIGCRVWVWSLRASRSRFFLFLFFHISFFY